MLEVGAHTRVRDVCAGVASKLQLASWEGCSLFIKIADKVLLAAARRGEENVGKGGSPTVLAGAPLHSPPHLKGYEDYGGGLTEPAVAVPPGGPSQEAPSL